MIKIIKDNCFGCGKCTKICPTNIIGLKNKKANLIGEVCLKCGHCQAICPANAILLNDEFPDEYNLKLNLSYDDVKTLIKTNRSIRKFQDELVSKEKIEDIIRATDFTGSAKNEQAIKWIVVSSKENVSKVSELAINFIKKENICSEVLTTIKNFRNPITLDAPHLIFAYADKNTIYPSIDGVIKIVSAELMMHSAGIGSCHLGYLINFVNNSKELRDYLGLDKDDMVYGALGFGYYSKEVYPHIPSRKKSEVKYI